MKQQLEIDLINALMPVIPGDRIDDAKMRITIALADWNVEKAETSLTVYEGDINEQILKRYMAAKLAQGCSKRTIKYYLQTLEFFFERVSKPYNDITADDIRAYIATRIYREGTSKTTANNERRNLSAFFSWLQKEEILLKNPMNRVDRVKETKKRKKAYEPMDLEKIRYGCNTNRERALVEILASTWCRASEVCGIRIADIEQDKVVVHGKGDKYRTVYLNARAQLALQAYLQERRDNNPYLFPKCSKGIGDFPKGGIERSRLALWYTDPEYVSETEPCTPSHIESVIRRIGKSKGLSNVHPHRFRRTGATMALRQGMPLITVSKLLGHESIETTQIYLDVSDEELELSHRKYVV